MADFTVRADSVNVEQIMDQIRARIREKRGVDYTEQQIREMATAKLEKFLDPKGVRSDLLDRFRNAQPVYTPPELPNYAFEEHTLFDSTRGLLRTVRRLLNPILKLFFNPGPLIQALNIQSRLNTVQAERDARRDATRHGMDQLYYEVMHNLVVETTRMAIEVKNLKMQVESLTGRLEFNERRARALESVVVYKPAEGTPPADLSTARVVEGPETPHPASGGSASQPPQPNAPPSQSQSSQTAQAATATEGPGQRSRRRRRRRGRRGGGSAASLMGAAGGTTPGQDASSEPHDEVAGAEADQWSDEGPDEPSAPSAATGSTVSTEPTGPLSDTAAADDGPASDPDGQ